MSAIHLQEDDIAPQEQLQQTEMTQEQRKNAIKEYLFKQYLEKYQDISKFINQLPIAFKMKEIVIEHFDTAYLWGRESFATLDLDGVQHEPVATDPVPEATKAKKKARKPKAKNGKRKSVRNA